MKSLPLALAVSQLPEEDAVPLPQFRRLGPSNGVKSLKTQQPTAVVPHDC